MHVATIVDDNRNFLETLQARWDGGLHSAYPDWDLHFLPFDPAASDPTDDVLALFPATTSHVLLDASLVDEELIRAITMQFPSALLWLYTGLLHEEEDQWKDWRHEFPPLQTEWFEKPLDLEQVLASLLAARPECTDKSAQLPRQETWEALPFPCREFDASFTPIWNNRHWQTAVDAFPFCFTEDEQNQLRDGHAITLDVWCERPDAKGQYAQVQLHTSRCADGNCYLQIALPVAEQESSAIDLATTIDNIFSLMIGSGHFSRARYYEVTDIPGTEHGVLTLVQAYPVIEQLPMQQPIGSTIARRIADYQQMPTQGSSRLYHQIRQPKDDQPDSDICYWNNIVDGGHVTWLEIPVMDQKNNAWCVQALLLFDRYRSQAADDSPGEQISPESVHRLEPRLLQVINYLYKELSNINSKKQLKRYSRFVEWHIELDAVAQAHISQPQRAELSKLEECILDAAKDFCLVESVLLAWRPPAADFLETRAFEDEEMQGLRLPLNLEHFIAVQCAVRKEPVFAPDFQGIPIKQQITDADWQATVAHFIDEKLRNERITHLKTWMTKKVGSVAALPVKYDDNLLGVLVLRHAKPYYFTDEIVETAQMLIRYAQPYLRHARAKQARDAWDCMIMHEFRGGLSNILNQIDIKRNESQDGQAYGKEPLDVIEARSRGLVDLSNEVMYLLGYSGSQPGRDYNRIDPLKVMHTEWESIFSLPEATNKSVQCTDNGPLSKALHDPNCLLPHVVSVLLHNAIRHGKTGKIYLTATALENSWLLTVENPGEFADSILHREFHNIAIREDLAQYAMRAHVGLAVCYRLLESVGGTLMIENTNRAGQPYAKANLMWPLAATTSSTHSKHTS